MRSFDYDFMNDSIGRLKTLDLSTKPQWGLMSAEQMIAHLKMAVDYTLGKEGTLPDKSNWFTRNLLGPLIVNGIVPVPKNVRVPSEMRARMRELPKCSIGELQESMEAFLSAVQTGSAAPPRHFVFGEIGVDGWSKMHVRHFEHHLKQFGV